MWILICMCARRRHGGIGGGWGEAPATASVGSRVGVVASLDLVAG